MTKPQRVVLIAGAVGVLHTSMVPPVAQYTNDVCRYAEFLDRGLPFTRTYAVANHDVAALLTEYGMIAAVTAVVFLVAGLFRKGRRTDA